MDNQNQSQMVDSNKNNLENDEGWQSSRIFGKSIYPYIIPKALVIIPFVITPYLYFLGKLYDITYFETLKIPIGILPDDLASAVFGGFVNGLLFPITQLYNFLYIIFAIGLFIFASYFIFLWMPKRRKALKNRTRQFIRDKADSIGREQVQEYIENVDENLKQTQFLPKLWPYIEGFGVISVCFVLTFYPVKLALENAERRANIFLKNANQSDCIKNPENNCKNFAFITLKSQRKISGFIALSGPKEWAIYQPPYISKKNSGNMLIVKRDAIIDVNHTISFESVEAQEPQHKTENKP